MITASSGGSSDSGIGGGYQRCGPTQPNGEARWLKTGSVRMRRPSISTSTDECPIQVTRRPLAGLLANRERSPGTVGSSPAGLVYELACTAPFTINQALFSSGC